MEESSSYLNRFLCLDNGLSRTLRDTGTLERTLKSEKLLRSQFVWISAISILELSRKVRESLATWATIVATILHTFNDGQEFYRMSRELISRTSNEDVQTAVGNAPAITLYTNQRIGSLSYAIRQRMEAIAG
jgi:hypothetical protein